ncbi:hypothetical protein M9Y10_005085 [Tritrichomonas musculus]|uniref:Uncharacterized protein n=1 Tax=Tritrichomonas musculus TaxID=1915356 RepID=A0ABR2JML5_9EUKA
MRSNFSVTKLEDFLLQELNKYLSQSPPLEIHRGLYEIAYNYAREVLDKKIKNVKAGSEKRRRHFPEAKRYAEICFVSNPISNVTDEIEASKSLSSMITSYYLKELKAGMNSIAPVLLPLKSKKVLTIILLAFFQPAIPLSKFNKSFEPLSKEKYPVENLSYFVELLNHFRSLANFDKLPQSSHLPKGREFRIANYYYTCAVSYSIQLFQRLTSDYHLFSLLTEFWTGFSIKSKRSDDSTQLKITMKFGKDNGYIKYVVQVTIIPSKEKKTEEILSQVPGYETISEKQYEEVDHLPNLQAIELDDVRERNVIIDEDTFTLQQSDEEITHVPQNEEITKGEMMPKNETEITKEEITNQNEFNENQNIETVDELSSQASLETNAAVDDETALKLDATQEADQQAINKGNEETELGDELSSQASLETNAAVDDETALKLDATQETEQQAVNKENEGTETTPQEITKTEEDTELEDLVNQLNEPEPDNKVEPIQTDDHSKEEIPFNADRSLNSPRAKQWEKISDTIDGEPYDDKDAADKTPRELRKTHDTPISPRREHKNKDELPEEGDEFVDASGLKEREERLANEQNTITPTTEPSSTTSERTNTITSPEEVVNKPDEIRERTIQLLLADEDEAGTTTPSNAVSDELSSQASLEANAAVDDETALKLDATQETEQQAVNKENEGTETTPQEITKTEEDTELEDLVNQLNEPEPDNKVEPIQTDDHSKEEIPFNADRSLNSPRAKQWEKISDTIDGEPYDDKDAADKTPRELRKTHDTPISPRREHKNKDELPEEGDEFVDASGLKEREERLANEQNTITPTTEPSSTTSERTNTITSPEEVVNKPDEIRERTIQLLLADEDEAPASNESIQDQAGINIEGELKQIPKISGIETISQKGYPEETNKDEQVEVATDNVKTSEAHDEWRTNDESTVPESIFAGEKEVARDEYIENQPDSSREASSALEAEMKNAQDEIDNSTQQPNAEVENYNEETPENNIPILELNQREAEREKEATAVHEVNASQETDFALDNQDGTKILSPDEQAIAAKELEESQAQNGVEPIQTDDHSKEEIPFNADRSLNSPRAKQWEKISDTIDGEPYDDKDAADKTPRELRKTHDTPISPRREHKNKDELPEEGDEFVDASGLKEREERLANEQNTITPTTEPSSTTSERTNTITSPEEVVNKPDEIRERTIQLLLADEDEAGTTTPSNAVSDELSSQASLEANAAVDDETALKLDATQETEQQAVNKENEGTETTPQEITKTEEDTELEDLVNQLNEPEPDNKVEPIQTDDHSKEEIPFNADRSLNSPRAKQWEKISDTIDGEPYDDKDAADKTPRELRKTHDTPISPRREHKNKDELPEEGDEFVDASGLKEREERLANEQNTITPTTEPSSTTSERTNTITSPEEVVNKPDEIRERTIQLLLADEDEAPASNESIQDQAGINIEGELKQIPKISGIETISQKGYPEETNKDEQVEVATDNVKTSEAHDEWRTNDESTVPESIFAGEKEVARDEYIENQPDSSREASSALEAEMKNAQDEIDNSTQQPNAEVENYNEETPENNIPILELNQREAEREKEATAVHEVNASQETDFALDNQDGTKILSPDEQAIAAKELEESQAQNGVEPIQTDDHSKEEIPFNADRSLNSPRAKQWEKISDTIDGEPYDDKDAADKTPRELRKTHDTPISPRREHKNKDELPEEGDEFVDASGLKEREERLANEQNTITPTTEPSSTTSERTNTITSPEEVVNKPDEIRERTIQLLLADEDEAGTTTPSNAVSDELSSQASLEANAAVDDETALKLDATQETEQQAVNKENEGTETTPQEITKTEEDIGHEETTSDKQYEQIDHLPNLQAIELDDVRERDVNIDQDAFALQQPDEEITHVPQNEEITKEEILPNQNEANKSQNIETTTPSTENLETPKAKENESPAPKKQQEEYATPTKTESKKYKPSRKEKAAARHQQEEETARQQREEEARKQREAEAARAQKNQQKPLSPRDASKDAWSAISDALSSSLPQEKTINDEQQNLSRSYSKKNDRDTPINRKNGRNQRSKSPQTKESPTVPKIPPMGHAAAVPWSQLKIVADGQEKPKSSPKPKEQAPQEQPLVQQQPLQVPPQEQLDNNFTLNNNFNQQQPIQPISQQIPAQELQQDTVVTREINLQNEPEVEQINQRTGSESPRNNATAWFAASAELSQIKDPLEIKAGNFASPRSQLQKETKQNSKPRSPRSNSPKSHQVHSPKVQPQQIEQPPQIEEQPTPEVVQAPQDSFAQVISPYDNEEQEANAPKEVISKTQKESAKFWATAIPQNETQLYDDTYTYNRDVPAEFKRSHSPRSFKEQQQKQNNEKREKTERKGKQHPKENTQEPSQYIESQIPQNIIENENDAVQQQNVENQQPLVSESSNSSKWDEIKSSLNNISYDDSNHYQQVPPNLKNSHQKQTTEQPQQQNQYQGNEQKKKQSPKPRDKQKTQYVDQLQQQEPQPQQEELTESIKEEPQSPKNSIWSNAVGKTPYDDKGNRHVPLQLKSSHPKSPRVNKDETTTPTHMKRKDNKESPRQQNQQRKDNRESPRQQNQQRKPSGSSTPSAKDNYEEQQNQGEYNQPYELPTKEQDYPAPVSPKANDAWTKLVIPDSTPEKQKKLKQNTQPQPQPQKEAHEFGSNVNTREVTLPQEKIVQPVQPMHPGNIPRINIGNIQEQIYKQEHPEEQDGQQEKQVQQQEPKILTPSHEKLAAWANISDEVYDDTHHHKNLPPELRSSHNSQVLKPTQEEKEQTQPKQQQKEQPPKQNSQRNSPRNSPRSSPRSSPRNSPRGSPRNSPRGEGVDPYHYNPERDGANPFHYSPRKEVIEIDKDSFPQITEDTKPQTSPRVKTVWGDLKIDSSYDDKNDVHKIPPELRKTHNIEDNKKNNEENVSSPRSFSQSQGSKSSRPQYTKSPKTPEQQNDKPTKNSTKSSRSARKEKPDRRQSPKEVQQPQEPRQLSPKAQIDKYYEENFAGISQALQFSESENPNRPATLSPRSKTIWDVLKIDSSYDDKNDVHKIPPELRKTHNIEDNKKNNEENVSSPRSFSQSQGPKSSRSQYTKSPKPQQNDGSRSARSSQKNRTYSPSQPREQEPEPEEYDESPKTPQKSTQEQENREVTPNLVPSSPWASFQIESYDDKNDVHKYPPELRKSHKAPENTKEDSPRQQKKEYNQKQSNYKHEPQQPPQEKETEQPPYSIPNEGEAPQEEYTEINNEQQAAGIDPTIEPAPQIKPKASKAWNTFTESMTNK